MSNPAVIFLAQCQTSQGESFRVEDNIGESIHIHYGNIRFDITIDELLDLASFLRNCINEIVDVDGFDINYFDPIFLKNIGSQLLDVEKIIIEEIRLTDLRIITKSRVKLPLISGLTKSMMFRALNGDKGDYYKYQQENMIFDTNQVRLDGIEEHMTCNEYPFNNEYIILFNNQNIIRDGQHRASVLLKNKIASSRLRFCCLLTTLRLI